MIISLVGKQVATLCTEFDAGGVEFRYRPPIPGTISNAGITIEVIGATGAGVMAVATAFKAWMKSRESRKVVITTKDGEVFYAAGMSPEDIAKLLNVAIGTMVFDTSKEPAAELQIDQSQ